MKDFGYQQIFHDLCMKKANMYLDALQANKEMKFKGRRRAYAAILCMIVSKELGLPLDEIDLVYALADRNMMVNTEMLERAKFELKKVFKEWFEQERDPNMQYREQFDKLEWPDELEYDLKHIVNAVKLET